MSNKITEYDEKGNVIYEKFPGSFGHWYKYDENNNQIYWKRSDGWECRSEYDENNREIYYKSCNGYGCWYKYNKSGNRIEITEKEYNDIEFRKKEKEYNSRTKCSRFELIDI